jgi:hypothetical protein
MGYRIYFSKWLMGFYLTNLCLKMFSYSVLSLTAFTNVIYAPYSKGLYLKVKLREISHYFFRV